MKRLSMIRTGQIPVVTFVGLALLLAACKSSPPPPPPSTDPVPSNYIPSTMTMAMRVDIGQLMAMGKNTEQNKKEFYDGLETRLPQAKQLLDALQIDVFKDIESAAFGLALFPGSLTPPDGVLAVKTSLALERLASVLKENASDKLAVASFSENGLQGYTVQGIGEENKVFLTSDSGMILASGTPEMLSSALEAKKSGSSAFSSGLLSDGFNAIDRSAQIAMALDGSLLTKNPQRPLPLPGANDIQHIAFSVRYGSQKWSVKGNFRFGDANNAKTMADMAKGILQGMGADPEMKDILGQFTIKDDKNNLVLDGYVTDKQVEEYAAKQQQQLRRFGAPR